MGVDRAPGPAAPGVAGSGAASPDIDRAVLASRLAIVARLGATPARLADLAHAVVVAEDATGSPAGAWSPRDVVAHLVAVEGAVWQPRLDELAASEGEPAWYWVEPGPIDDPAAASLGGALGLFTAGRRMTLDRLAALDEAGWARVGRHATFGRLDVLGLARVAADHDDEHLAALEARVGDHVPRPGGSGIADPEPGRESA